MSRSRFRFAFAAPGSFVALVACAGAAQNPGGSAASTEAMPVAVPDVELRDATGALVGAKAIPMDGLAEGLAWPALRTALTRKPGEHAPLTIAVARAVPMSTVMRAVWTLRDADLRLQTPDAAGTPRVLALRPKPDMTASSTPTDAACHLAVFVAPNGDLSVAMPGGPHLLPGPDAPAALARALASERAGCPIRYVAFGAQSADAPWSAVFDVARAVDRDKAAGDARYVLGEPVHLPSR